MTRFVTYKKIFWDDLKKAEKEEENHVEQIKQALQIEKLEKDQDRFSVYDFFCEKGFVEFRRRYNDLSKYPTTMIPYSKIAFSNRNPKVPCFIFIKFNDCLTYWEVPKWCYKNFERGGRRDRGIDEFAYGKKYYYLPIEELIVVD